MIPVASAHQVYHQRKNLQHITRSGPPAKFKAILMSRMRSTFLTHHFNDRRRIFSIYLILSAALGPRVFTQALTEISMRSRQIMFQGSRARPVRRADNFAAIYELMSNNVGFLTSHNPIDLHGLLRE
jgi:hypothetical protein